MERYLQHQTQSIWSATHFRQTFSGLWILLQHDLACTSYFALSMRLLNIKWEPKAATWFNYVVTMAETCAWYYYYHMHHVGEREGGMFASERKCKWIFIKIIYIFFSLEAPNPDMRRGSDRDGRVFFSGIMFQLSQLLKWPQNSLAEALSSVRPSAVFQVVL